jgi:hypothetical protein
MPEWRKGTYKKIWRFVLGETWKRISSVRAQVAVTTPVSTVPRMRRLITR